MLFEHATQLHRDLSTHTAILGNPNSCNI